MKDSFEIRWAKAVEATNRYIQKIKNTKVSPYYDPKRHKVVKDCDHI